MVSAQTIVCPTTSKSRELKWKSLFHDLHAKTAAAAAASEHDQNELPTHQPLLLLLLPIVSQSIVSLSAEDYPLYHEKLLLLLLRVAMHRRYVS